jgi:hypothetical protein
MHGTLIVKLDIFIFRCYARGQLKSLRESAKNSGQPQYQPGLEIAIIQTKITENYKDTQ